MTNFLPADAVITPEQAPAQGPQCTLCGEPVGGDRVGVNWQRRLTDDELAVEIAAEKSRREQVLLLADPQQPAPVFPPLPDGADFTRTIYACGDHAIHMDAAALIHQGSCTAPNLDHLPGCDCTPESLPEPSDEEPSRLPDHWQTGGA